MATMVVPASPQVYRREMVNADLILRKFDFFDEVKLKESSFAGEMFS